MMLSNLLNVGLHMANFLTSFYLGGGLGVVLMIWPRKLTMRELSMEQGRVSARRKEHDEKKQEEEQYEEHDKQEEEEEEQVQEEEV